jgi:hypothetical protein
MSNRRLSWEKIGYASYQTSLLLLLICAALAHPSAHATELFRVTLLGTGTPAADPIHRGLRCAQTLSTLQDRVERSDATGTAMPLLLPGMPNVRGIIGLSVRTNLIRPLADLNANG